MPERITRRLVITGRVQGVWYRESMRQEAERLAVAGWVRNRPDGSVEAVAHGEEAAVTTLIAWSRRGPPAAKVDQVRVTEAAGSYERFEKLPSQ